MAKVTLQHEPPVPPPVLVSVTLHLTPEEASALLRVVRNVGGGGRRKLIDPIFDALTASGIDAGPNDVQRPGLGDPSFGQHLIGSIYFKE